ncbi:MAG: DUF255 domain-containing protein [Bacteroidia bacterium]|nr:DUF255 domain-containing protein [Bacteroidia bacterium]
MYFLILAGWLSLTTVPASPAAEPVQWVSLPEAVRLSQQDGKKIFIDFYTDWCGWCKRMDRDTYAQPEVAAYLNTHYHAVKFNAEKPGDIVLDGVTYGFLGQPGKGGIHEIAYKLMNGQPSYPTSVFLEPDGNLITRVPGYLTGPDFMPILHFIGENHYQKQTWDTFMQSWQQP